MAFKTRDFWLFLRKVSAQAPAVARGRGDLPVLIQLFPAARGAALKTAGNEDTRERRARSPAHGSPRARALMTVREEESNTSEQITASRFWKKHFCLSLLPCLSFDHGADLRIVDY